MLTMPNLYKNRLQPLSANKKDAVKFTLRQRKRKSTYILVVIGKDRYTYNVDPMQLGIMKHIPDFKNKNPRELLRMGYCLYKYALRLSRVTDMKKLQAVDLSEITAIKDSIFTSYDLVLYKMATIKCMLQKYHPVKHWVEIGDVFESYGLLRADRLLYCFLYHSGDMATMAKMLQSVEDGFPLTPTALTAEINESSTYTRIRNAASHYSSKKLTFIAKGNRFEKKDMAADLQLRGIQAYYWVRPYYNKLHAINYACSAMLGWTMCLIDHYTDPERARIYATPEGYENITMDMTGLSFSDRFTEDAMITYLDLKAGAYENA